MRYFYYFLAFTFFSLQFSFSQTTLLDQDFESESTGTIGTSSGSPPYQLDLSFDGDCNGTASGWNVSTSNGYSASCSSCSNKRARISYYISSCAQDHWLYTATFTPTQSTVSVGFNYGYDDYDSGAGEDNFDVYLLNVTTSSSTSLLSLSSDAENATYSNSSVSVSAGNSYRLVFRYRGQYDNGATVDNILVTEESTDPLITVGSAITGLDYDNGYGPSTSQSTTVSGVNLTANIVLSAPTNFEISSDNTSFSSSVSLTPSSGAVSSTTIYARLKSGASVNNYSGNITCTSTGATNKTIALSGEVNEVYYVSTTGINSNDGLSWENAFLTLTQAISSASPGSAIYISDGTFSNDAEITINKSLTIKGNSREETIFDGTSSGANEGLFIITSDNVTIRNLTIQDYSLNSTDEFEGGAAVRIGAARSTASAPDEITGLLLKNIKFYNNSSTNIHGAAIYFVKNTNSSNHDVDVEECLFYDNTASRGPVGYAYDGVTADWRNCVMIDNKAESYGAVIYHKDTESGSADGVMNFYNCTMYRNRTQLNASSNAAIRSYATEDHVTHNIYNSIILYTLQTDSNWDYLSLGNSHLISDLDTSTTSAVYLNIYNSYVTKINTANLDDYSSLYDHYIGSGDSGGSNWPSSGNFGADKKLYPMASTDALVGSAGGNATSIDVNGVTRPQGSGIDIGAYEYRNTWVGGTSTDWATASNWSLNTVPSSSSAYDSPKIPDVSGASGRNPVISTDIIIDNIKIDNGGSLTIQENGSLKLTENLINNGTLTMNSTATNYSSLIVQGKSYGEYVHLSDYTNSTKYVANITYNRYVNIAVDSGANEWDIVGSPVDGLSISSFVTTNSSAIATSGSTYALGYYDNSNDTWTNYNTSTVGGAGNLTLGKGYQMASASGATMAFTGTVATSTQTQSIINNHGSGRRWNLVANPFPSYIHLNNHNDATNNFLTVNSAVIDNSHYAAVYGYDADGSGYTIYNNAVDSPSDYIAPGQAFMVAAQSSSAADISFTPAMRTTSGSDDFVSGRLAQSTWSRFYLRLYEDENFTSETKFYFDQGLSLGLDPGYDAGAMGQDDLMSRLVEQDQGVGMAMNAMGLSALEEETVIPLVLNRDAGVEFSISFEDSSIPENVDVYLEDTLLETLTNLRSSGFTLTPESDLSDMGRFYLRIGNTSLGGNDLDESYISIYKAASDDFVTIEGLSNVEKANVQLFNIIGQEVINKTLNSNQSTQRVSTSGLTTGVYVIRLKADSSVIAKKIIIN